MEGENFKPSTEIKYNAVNVDRETLSDAFGLPLMKILTALHMEMILMCCHFILC